MTSTAIKFYFELPSTATKENILYAYIDYIIESFGKNLNVKICDSKYNENYYYLIFDSYEFYDKDKFNNLISELNTDFKNISFTFNSYQYNNDISFNFNDKYRIINGIIEHNIELV